MCSNYNGAYEVGGERGLESVIRAGLRDGRSEECELALREARLREVRHVQLVHQLRATLQTTLTHLHSNIYNRAYVLHRFIHLTLNSELHLKEKRLLLVVLKVLFTSLYEYIINICFPTPIQVYALYLL